MVYVQRNGDGYLVTVDEFETWMEGIRMLQEYRMSDRSARYYLSQRACNDWREDSKKGAAQ
jgi:hypothetical protein